MGSLREELESIRATAGVLTPAVVLEAASAPDHPLHTRFEWDDTVAAGKWRLEQAQKLLTVVRLSYIDGSGQATSIRAYQAVRTEHGHVYRPSDEVAMDPVASQIVLMDMQREFKQLRDRYGHFREYAEMIRAAAEAEAG